MLSNRKMKIYLVCADALFLLIASALPSFTIADRAHILEIKDLADVLALSQVVVDHCPGVKINTASILLMRSRVNYDNASDAKELIEQKKISTAVFETEFSHMSLLKKNWCDVKYKLFGPTGQLFPGVMVWTERER